MYSIAIIAESQSAVPQYCVVISGGSSGAALSVALKEAKQLKAGQRCVVVLPDSIRNYL